MHETEYLTSTQGLVDRIRECSRSLEPIPTQIEPKLTRCGDIRAVLFDVYGTLVISTSGDIGVDKTNDDGSLFRAALVQAGLADDPPGENISIAEPMRQAIRNVHEQRRREGIEYPEVDILCIWEQVLAALPEGTIIRGTISAVSLKALAVEYECLINPVWPMPGAQEILATLNKKKGLVLGIVSNAQFYTPLIFEALLGATPTQLGFSPDLCIWSYTVGEAKPSVHLLQRALTALTRIHDIEPSQTLYVGNDKLKDIWPAASLGCKTVLFAGDRCSLNLRNTNIRCRSLEPDAIITDLRQLAVVL